MTTVSITEDVRLTIESNCVTIEQRSIAKRGKSAGEESWSSVGFYGDVTGAAQALVGRHLGLIAGAGQVMSLQELIVSVRKAAKDVAAAVRASDGPQR